MSCCSGGASRYPPVNQGGKENFPCLKGNMSSNGPYSIANVSVLEYIHAIPCQGAKSMSLHVAALSNIKYCWSGLYTLVSRVDSSLTKHSVKAIAGFLHI